MIFFYDIYIFNFKFDLLFNFFNFIIINFLKNIIYQYNIMYTNCINKFFMSI